MKLSLMTAAFFVITLSACGGSSKGNNDNNSAAVTTVSDAEIIANLKSSNIDFLTFRRPAGTWRWSGTPQQHILVYVPTPANGNALEQDYAKKTQNAITLINTKLRNLLILEAVSTIPTNSHFIQVSYGTSYVPAGSTDYKSYCANVSEGPSIGNMIQPNEQNGINSNPVFINLGNGHCDVTQDIVTHEFGHALGLSNHFNGFGNGAAISTGFWDVLATLYGNPQSTTAQNLLVRRAGN